MYISVHNCTGTQEMGHGKWCTGNGAQEMVHKEWHTGSGTQEVAHRKWRTQEVAHTGSGAHILCNVIIPFLLISSQN